MFCVCWDNVLITYSISAHCLLDYTEVIRRSHDVGLVLRRRRGRWAKSKQHRVSIPCLLAVYTSVV